MSVYVSLMNSLQSTMWPKALVHIHLTLLAYDPEQIYVPRCICVFQNNNNGPLTAVLSVTMTVIPNFPCFYRWVLRVWCHLTSSRQEHMCKIAWLLIGQFIFTLWVTWTLFVLNDSDWSILVIWAKQFAMAFFNYIVFIRWYFL